MCDSATNSGKGHLHRESILCSLCELRLHHRCPCKRATTLYERCIMDCCHCLIQFWLTSMNTPALCRFDLDWNARALSYNVEVVQLIRQGRFSNATIPSRGRQTHSKTVSREFACLGQGCWAGLQHRQPIPGHRSHMWSGRSSNIQKSWCWWTSEEHAYQSKCRLCW
jgi:hypothetical protein